MTGEKCLPRDDNLSHKELVGTTFVKLQRRNYWGTEEASGHDTEFMEYLQNQRDFMCPSLYKSDTIVLNKVTRSF